MGGRADAAARAQVNITCCGNSFRPVAASLADRQCLKAQSKHHAAELPFGCAACAPPPKLEIAPPVGVLFGKQAALARKLITQNCEKQHWGAKGTASTVHFVACRCPAGWHETADAVCDERAFRLSFCILYWLGRLGVFFLA